MGLGSDSPSNPNRRGCIGGLWASRGLSAPARECRRCARRPSRSQAALAPSRTGRSPAPLRDSANLRSVSSRAPVASSPAPSASTRPRAVPRAIRGNGLLAGPPSWYASQSPVGTSTTRAAAGASPTAATPPSVHRMPRCEVAHRFITCTTLGNQGRLHGPFRRQHRRVGSGVLHVRARWVYTAVRLSPGALPLRTPAGTAGKGPGGCPGAPRHDALRAASPNQAPAGCFVKRAYDACALKPLLR